MTPSIVLVIAALGLTSCDKISENVGKGGSSQKKNGESLVGGSKPAHAMLETLKEAVQTSRGSAPEGPVVKHLGAQDYEGFISSPGKLVIVEYHANWCGPCKSLSPVLEQLAADSGGKVIFGKIDVDANPSLAETAGVRSIPDVRFFRDGRQVDRFIGILKREEIQALISKHGPGLDTAPGKMVSGDPQRAGAPAPPSAGGSSSVFQRMDKNWMPPGIQKR